MNQRSYDDAWQDPRAKEWVRRVRDEVVPKITDSALTISLVPDAEKVDIKFAVELGLSIMLNKPIIAVVLPGTNVSPKLAMVADEIVEGSPDPKDPQFRDRLIAAMKRVAPDV